jgi:hypothetical protein
VVGPKPVSKQQGEPLVRRTGESAVQADVLLTSVPLVPVPLGPAVRWVVTTSRYVVLLVRSPGEPEGCQWLIERGCGGVEVGDADLQIEHRLRCHARDAGAADVIHPKRERCQRGVQIAGESFTLSLPRRIVRNDERRGARFWIEHAQQGSATGVGRAPRRPAIDVEAHPFRGYTRRDTGSDSRTTFGKAARRVHVPEAM